MAGAACTSSAVRFRLSPSRYINTHSASGARRNCLSMMGLILPRRRLGTVPPLGDVPDAVGAWSERCSNSSTVKSPRKYAMMLFESPRKPGHPVGKRYVSDVVTRGVTRANAGRTERIARINVHGLRHTFAAIALSEAGGDILSVSRALGHSKPSTTLNEYGHLAPAGLEPLMARIDGLVGGKGTSA